MDTRKQNTSFLPVPSPVLWQELLGDEELTLKVATSETPNSGNVSQPEASASQNVAKANHRLHFLIKISTGKILVVGLMD